MSDIIGAENQFGKGFNRPGHTSQGTIVTPTSHITIPASIERRLPSTYLLPLPPPQPIISNIVCQVFRYRPGHCITFSLERPLETKKTKKFSGYDHVAWHSMFRLLIRTTLGVSR
ncbi:hypothetical protein JB92DRAFT_1065489 [Gautieria morchelliformis]|nr:hypothetical protein JB92DRAFT_1065489 [Gautieria morchelliformis]